MILSLLDDYAFEPSKHNQIQFLEPTTSAALLTIQGSAKAYKNHMYSKHLKDR